MCMHIQNESGVDLDIIMATVETMDRADLDRMQDTIGRRRKTLAESNVIERRPYESGVLQLETRAYRRKNGELTRRGPYWYFHYREGGEQKTLYIGKTDDPERKLDEKLGKE
jgi:hypothetical protein